MQPHLISDHELGRPLDPIALPAPPVGRARKLGAAAPEGLLHRQTGKLAGLVVHVDHERRTVGHLQASRGGKVSHISDAAQNHRRAEPCRSFTSIASTRHRCRIVPLPTGSRAGEHSRSRCILDAAKTRGCTRTAAAQNDALRQACRTRALASFVAPLRPQVDRDAEPCQSDDPRVMIARVQRRHGEPPPPATQRRGPFTCRTPRPAHRNAPTPYRCGGVRTSTGSMLARLRVPVPGRYRVSDGASFSGWRRSRYCPGLAGRCRRRGSTARHSSPS